jgi:hypothetical protein
MGRLGESSNHHSVCIECGHKCCYGVTVTQGGDDQEQAELSHSVCDNGVCNFHDGEGCSIYGLRPVECKNYVCDKIK